MTRIFQHTPGPWECNGSGLIYGQAAPHSDEAPLVCDVARDGVGLAIEEEHANARLIAAAPAQALLLDLVRYGLATLCDGEIEYRGTVYGFDEKRPDWSSLMAALPLRIVYADITEAIDKAL